ncbi:hemagglutinin [Vaccinia virus]|nr:hemagglutinin [Vaccinia virus]
MATPEPIIDNVEDHTDTVTYTSDGINTLSASSGESTTDENPEPIADNEEHTVTDTVSYTTVSTSSGIVTTKATTDVADLYDTYKDNDTVQPTTVGGSTTSISNYKTKDFVEIFGITAVIILSAVAIVCITYYLYNQRSRKYKTENKV